MTGLDIVHTIVVAAVVLAGVLHGDVEQVITRVPSNGNPGIVPPWLQKPLPPVPPKQPIPFIPNPDTPRILLP